MQRFDPRAELAPRDIVARAIDHEMKRLGIDCVSTAGSAEEGLAIATADLPEYAALDLKMDGD